MAKTTTAKASLTSAVGDRDHILGPDEAKITLVEYGDLQCYHCRQVQPVIRQLRERLGNRLRYVFRHFPISSIHPDANLAAQATEAAGAQGKFWEMHDTVFEHQGELDRDHLLEYAGELELDIDRFMRELDEGVHAERVREDFLSGVKSGVNGTPTFFINGVRYDGAWDIESLLLAIEKPLGVRINLIFQEFARVEALSGILLLAATILALVLANTAWAESYYHFWETEIGIAIGGLDFSHHLIEWVNDGLMVIFFFVVGLEIKREFTVGELSNIRQAAVPIMAAVGGMIFPAVFYLSLNAGGAGQSGWGVPMATDIAFTLGVLALLGSRAPLVLKVFFTALAIADDLGAVIVIALFYTEEVAWIWLLVAAIIFVILVAMNRWRVYSVLPYAILGIGLWFAFFESGIHPTIAGVLLALTIPTRSPPDTGALLAQCISVLNEFEKRALDDSHGEERTQVAAQTLGTVSERMQSPAQRLEHDLLPWTTYVILPIFALANAGVTLTFDRSLLSPVSLGIMLGLVFGKPIGVSLLTWLAVKLKLAVLPENITMKQLFGASFLTGIGFTMALFIANSAFTDPELLDQAKVGILIASLLAGVTGYVLTIFLSPTYKEVSSMEASPATD
jgi:NhaA family Na+:H+ antiporter